MREALGIGEGDTLEIEFKDFEVRISTRRAKIRKAQEWARKAFPAGVSLADELSTERSEAAKLE